jgi:hypothetical protein
MGSGEAWRGFLALMAELNLVLALIGLGFALAPLREGALAAATLLFVGSDVAAALRTHELMNQIAGIEIGLVNGTFLGALASVIAGAALLAPDIVATPIGLIAAVGNGLITGGVIAATTPAGGDELSFTVGALSASILLVTVALTGRRLLGSPAWTRIAGKILGAWLVAIAGLLLALPTRHSPPKPSAISSVPAPPKAFRSVVPP